jgi:hypothetical protein
MNWWRIISYHPITCLQGMKNFTKSPVRLQHWPLYILPAVLLLRHKLTHCYLPRMHESMLAANSISVSSFCSSNLRFRSVVIETRHNIYEARSSMQSKKNPRFYGFPC